MKIFSILFKILLSYSTQTRSEGFLAGRKRGAVTAAPWGTQLPWAHIPPGLVEQEGLSAQGGGSCCDKRAVGAPQTGHPHGTRQLPQQPACPEQRNLLIPKPRAAAQEAKRRSSARSQRHQSRVPCRSTRPLGDEEELGCAERCPPGFSCDSLVPFSDRITGCWEISDLKTSTLRFLFSICQNNIENRFKTGGRSMKMGRDFAIRTCCHLADQILHR